MAEEGKASVEETPHYSLSRQTLENAYTSIIIISMSTVLFMGSTVCSMCVRARLPYYPSKGCPSEV